MHAYFFTGDEGVPRGGSPSMPRCITPPSVAAWENRLPPRERSLLIDAMELVGWMLRKVQWKWEWRERREGWFVKRSDSHAQLRAVETCDLVEHRPMRL
jgi:hypothetical protein